MNSVFKLSLFAAALAFAAPNVAMAATAHHQDAHKYYKGHTYSKKVIKSGKHAQKNQESQGDQETADLNARSLQVVQAVNTGNNPGAVRQVAPNVRAPLNDNQNLAGTGNVVVAPGTGNVVAPPSAPGAVNPNNMPPAQY